MERAIPKGTQGFIAVISTMLPPAMNSFVSLAYHQGSDSSTTKPMDIRGIDTFHEEFISIDHFISTPYTLLTPRN